MQRKSSGLHLEIATRNYSSIQRDFLYRQDVDIVCERVTDWKRNVKLIAAVTQATVFLLRWASPGSRVISTWQRRRNEE
jgi:hypothetical protein